MSNKKKKCFIIKNNKNSPSSAKSASSAFYKLCNFATLKLCHSAMRKIKLIWDFRGPAAAKTAEHHEKHLKEYIAIEKLPLDITGFDVLNEMYSTAWMVVTEEYMIQVRDALKPHSGEVYAEQ